MSGCHWLSISLCFLLSIFRVRLQQPKARLLPLVLSVIVVSFGCFIHGSSVVFGGIAVVGLDTASRTIKPNSNSTELGFDWDNTKYSAWLGKTELITQPDRSNVQPL